MHTLAFTFKNSGHTSKHGLFKASAPSNHCLLSARTCFQPKIALGSQHGVHGIHLRNKWLIQCSETKRPSSSLIVSLQRDRDWHWVDLWMCSSRASLVYFQPSSNTWLTKAVQQKTGTDLKNLGGGSGRDFPHPKQLLLSNYFQCIL